MKRAVISRHLPGLGLAAAVVVIAFAAAPGAWADTFTVNSTDDFSDANPGDASCADGSGNCTLRAAIEEANALSGPDTVNLPPGTYPLEVLGNLEVSSNVTVDGTGNAQNTVIRRTMAGNIFAVTPAGRLDLRDATVRDGVLAAPGGGIHSQGRLILRRTVVKANQAFGDNFGGGIFSSGPAANLTILNSVIGDPAGGAQANRAGAGGGLVAAGGYTIRNSVITGNQATDPALGLGGGMITSGDGLIADSTVSNNSAGGGGAIFHTDIVPGAPRTLRIERSTLSGNNAIQGGAIYNIWPLQIVNSTLSGNSVSNRAGALRADANATLTHTTIAGNTAPLAAGIYAVAGVSTLRASVLDNQGERNCGLEAGGTVSSTGANVDSGTTCGLGGPGDVSNTDPGLGPLAQNGGPTRTRAIAQNSPARDRAGACGLATDQRGVARPQGPACDSGAFEGAFEVVLPSNEFGFGKVKKNRKRGTAKLTVIVPGPGQLSLAKSKKVKGKQKRAPAAGKQKLPVKPKGKAKKKLAKKGKAKVKAKVSYTPDGGDANTKSKRVKLVKR